MNKLITSLLLGFAALLMVLTLTSCQGSSASTAPKAQAALESSATPKPAFYCKGITLKGAHCTRRVKADGDYCWQHEIQKNPCWRPKGSAPKEDCYYQDGDVTRPIDGKP
jgi:hypothetical protein